MQALGERMAAQIGYSNQFGWELYDTTGTTEDYSYNATGGYGYTFEIGPDEFHPPFEDVVAEYLGTTEAAQAVTADDTATLTTSAGRDCGELVGTDTVGGGLREAYFLALENAADSATHSRLVGQAPAGAEIGVTRTGEFPLWDGTPVEDTVTTAMVGGRGRRVRLPREPLDPPVRRVAALRRGRDDGARGGRDLRGGAHGDHPPAGRRHLGRGRSRCPTGVDSLVVTLTADVPADDYDIQLLSPDLVVLDESANGGTDERVEHVGRDRHPAGRVRAADPELRRGRTVDDDRDHGHRRGDRHGRGPAAVLPGHHGGLDRVLHGRRRGADHPRRHRRAGRGPRPRHLLRGRRRRGPGTGDRHGAGRGTVSPLPTTGGGAALAALLALGATAGVRRRR